MTAVEKEIERRNIPSALRAKNGKEISTAQDFEQHRKLLKTMLEEHIFGYIPERPDHLSVELVSEDKRFCAGKAPLVRLNFKLTFGESEFSFPVNAVIPKSDKKLPAFISINFSSEVSNKYLPSEEIADNGFAVFSFCYKDVTSDDGNFKDGIAKFLSPKRRTLNSPGKIAMWAFAAMRVMDYVQTLDTIDCENVAVIGHSRLGKTALLTAAFDERFKYAISNNSGCTGAAILRGKVGESLDAITTRFDYWFSKRYKNYAADERKLPLDQNFLTSLIAPRYLLIGSAESDIWADPKSEFLGAVLGGKAWEIYGLPGLIHNGEFPKAKTVLDEGCVCYHVRKGEHFLSRDDWSVYMNFIKKHAK